MGVKERLIMFIDYIKSNQRRFEMSIGKSTGYINNIRKSIPEDVVSKISEIYPNLNKSWLLFGEGEMISNSTHIQSKAVANQNIDSLIKSISEAIESMRVLIESNKILAQTNREQWLRINSSETASASSSDEVAGGLIRKTIEYGDSPLDKSVQENDPKGQKLEGTYSKTNK